MAGFRIRNHDPGGTSSVQIVEEVTGIGTLAGIKFTGDYYPGTISIRCCIVLASLGISLLLPHGDSVGWL